MQYSFGDPRLPLKFWNKVQINESTQCWDWKAEAPWGYGRINIGKRQWLAHRLSYSALVGKIPGELQIDHLCRNRSCVNPAHLEPVTQSVNSMRSPLVRKMIAETSARQSSKTHCPKGHPYSGENLILVSGKYNRRECRACRRAVQRANYERNAELRRARSRAYHAVNRDERRAKMRAAYYAKKAAIKPPRKDHEDHD